MGKKSTDTTENKASKEDKQDKSKTKEPAGEAQKIKSAEESSKSKVVSDAKSETPPEKKTSPPPSSKPQATPSVGKDAFGRPMCGVEEGGPGCHESHGPFQKNSNGPKRPVEKGVKKSKRSFTEVDDAKVGRPSGSSAYSRISEYCQSLVGRGTADGPSAVAAETGVVVARRRGRVSSLVGQPKLLQLMGRWLPAAGLYAAATAALAVWLTEWGPVVNRIPYYRDREEAAGAKAKPPVPPQDTPETPQESSPAILHATDLPAALEESPATTLPEGDPPAPSQDSEE